MGNANKKRLKKNKEIRYSNKKYNFKKAICTPNILNQILLFLEPNDIQSLELCCKEINQTFYNQLKQIKINEKIDTSI